VWSGFFLSCAVVRSEKKENDESAEKKRYSRTSVGAALFIGVSLWGKLVFGPGKEALKWEERRFPFGLKLTLKRVDCGGVPL
jgi:hypothetical protein